MELRRTSRARLVLLTLGLLLAASVVAAGDQASELTAIENTLQDYLQGGKNGDLVRLRTAFHPNARIQFVRNGKFTEWSLDDYIGAQMPGRRSSHETKVLSIDFSGSAASAKLELDFGKHKFIDYMSLLKIGDRWWIVNKIFYRSNG